MVEHTPEQPGENLPEGEINKKWRELLNDPEIDPENRAYFKELWEIDEKKIWTDREIRRRLIEDSTFAPSLYFGFLQLLEAQGFAQNGEVVEHFEELADVFTGQKQASIEERIRSIHEARKHLLSLGFSEKSLQAKELLLRAAIGGADVGETEGEQMLKKEIHENPRLKKLLEEFDQEAHERESGEKGHGLYL